MICEGPEFLMEEGSFWIVITIPKIVIFGIVINLRVSKQAKTPKSYKSRRYLLLYESYI